MIIVDIENNIENNQMDENCFSALGIMKGKNGLKVANTNVFNARKQKRSSYL